jgi:hypothetical protein
VCAHILPTIYARLQITTVMTSDEFMQLEQHLNAVIAECHLLTSALLTAAANNTRDDVGWAGSRRSDPGPIGRQKPCPPPRPRTGQRQRKHPVLAGLVGQPAHATGLVDMAAGRLALCELGG